MINGSGLVRKASGAPNRTDFGGKGLLPSLAHNRDGRFVM
jgi:hypothetical protein